MAINCMRVLLTNNTLASRAGTEMYVVDVARRLKALGHEPMAFSTQLGEVAETLKASEIPVVSELDDLPAKPDIIHGQHHLETMLAMLSLPAVPVIYFCHGALPWEEAPPLFPRIRHYVAVDEACRQRVVEEARVPAEKVHLLLNFVDLQRFQPRPPLPERPRRALVFSNYMEENNLLKTVRQACIECGIELDVRGLGVGRPIADPEALLQGYDLVFAKSRAALEAMAVGAAVVVCDTRGCGSMVTSSNFDSLRPLNFGFRTMRQAITIENLIAQIRSYNPAEAVLVRDKVRSQAGMVAAVDQIVGFYQQAMAESAVMDSADKELISAGNYLRWLTPVIKLGVPHYNSVSANSEEERSLKEQLDRKMEELALTKLALSRCQVKLARSKQAFSAEKRRSMKILANAHSASLRLIFTISKLLTRYRVSQR